MRIKILLLLTVLALAASAQTTQTDPSFILGTGSGFKPYQTPLKSGASAFVEGFARIASGTFAVVRVEMRATDAQMIVEGCKAVYSNTANRLLLCGGPGFGADANNIGMSFAGGGKWLFSPRKLQQYDTWVGIEIGVAKTTVPAPVQGSTTVSPVQPDFRIGIHKEFR